MPADPRDRRPDPAPAGALRAAPGPAGWDSRPPPASSGRYPSRSRRTGRAFPPRWSLPPSAGPPAPPRPGTRPRRARWARSVPRRWRAARFPRTTGPPAGYGCGAPTAPRTTPRRPPLPHPDDVDLDPQRGRGLRRRAWVHGAAVVHAVGEQHDHLALAGRAPQPVRRGRDPRADRGAVLQHPDAQALERLLQHRVVGGDRDLGEGLAKLRGRAPWPGDAPARRAPRHRRPGRCRRRRDRAAPAGRAARRLALQAGRARPRRDTRGCRARDARRAPPAPARRATARLRAWPRRGARRRRASGHRAPHVPVEPAAAGARGAAIGAGPPRPPPAAPATRGPRRAAAPDCD